MRAGIVRTACFVIFAFLMACEIAVSSVSASAVEETDAHRIITMTGEATVNAMPDQALVNAGAVTQEKTAAAAVAANAEIMSAAVAAVRQLGVPEQAISTNGFDLEPQYPPEDPKNPQPRTIIGYQVTNSVNVRLSNVSRAGAVLDALIDTGVNQSAGVSFSIKNPQPLLDQARALAAKDALKRAQIYTGAIGAVLGPVRSIHEGYSEPYSSRENGIEQVVVTAERRATPVEPGEQSVSANVTIVWALK